MLEHEVGDKGFLTGMEDFGFAQEFPAVTFCGAPFFCECSFNAGIEFGLWREVGAKTIVRGEQQAEVTKSSTFDFSGELPVAAADECWEEFGEVDSVSPSFSEDRGWAAELNLPAVIFKAGDVVHEFGEACGAEDAFEVATGVDREGYGGEQSDLNL